MADQRIGNLYGVARATNGSGNERSNLANADGDPRTTYVNANLNDIATMRTRLAAINAAVYTDAVLNTMTFNDMVYAIRVADDPTSIKQ